MSKTSKIKQHLIEKGTITSLEAFNKYKATRLSGIIHILRNQGWVINTEMVRGNGDNYGIYHLESLPKDNE